MPERLNDDDDQLLPLRLLTAREAGRLLGVSARTIRRWTREGRLHAHRTPGRGLRWRVEELLAAVTDA